MICNHCNQEPSVDNCCQYCHETEPTIATALSRPKQGKMTFVVDVDRTGSSKAFQVGIPKTFKLIGEEIKKIVIDIDTYLISHGDLDFGQEIVLHVDSGTIDETAEEIERIFYGGGGDIPEHHLDAIEFITETVPFDPRGHAAILTFITDETKPCLSGKSAQELGAELQQRNIKLFLICQPTPTLTELVESANGFIFPISNNPSTEEYEAIIQQLSTSMTASIRSGSTIQAP